MLSEVAAGTAALSILLLVIGFARQGQVETTRDRLNRMVRQQRGTFSDTLLMQPFVERCFRPLRTVFGPVASRWTPQKAMNRIQQKITYAALGDILDAPAFVALRLIAAVGLALMLAAMGMMMHTTLSTAGLAALAGAGLGFLLPGIWLGGKAKKRQDAIRSTLPDTLDLLVLCVEVMSFERALVRVAEKSKTVMGDELSRTANDINFGGVSRSEALHRLAERVGLDDLRGLVATFIQADQMGTPPAQTLRAQAGDMRVRRRQRAETLAREAPVKMMFPLVLLILPPLFIVLLGPAIPQMLHSVAPTLKL